MGVGGYCLLVASCVAGCFFRDVGWDVCVQFAFVVLLYKISGRPFLDHF